MEFGILGPLQLLAGSGQITQPRGRQRDLLALLIVRARQTISSDRLIDTLWGDHLPANPTNALQQRVFAVRRLLGDSAESLVTAPSGYRLEVADGAIDARRFERLAEDGRVALGAGEAADAEKLLDGALTLWRGRPLQDIDALWAITEAERLVERRLAAIEDRIDAQLTLGGHQRVIEELETLTIEHPLRERLHGQLMVALAGVGRQADALSVYTRLRRLLAEELGIDPTPRVQQLHRDVLNQGLGHGAPQPAPPAPHTAPPPSRGDSARAPATTRPSVTAPTGSTRFRDERRVGSMLDDDQLAALTPALVPRDR